MKPPRIDPARLEAFALAYAPAARAAVDTLPGFRGDITPDEYAVAMTEAMVAAVQRAGAAGIEHYYINTHGGALRATCQALGVERDQLDHYLRGDK